MNNEMRASVRTRIPVVVYLLSGERVNFTAERHWTIANIYSESCDYLGIAESRIFGLATKSDDTFVFLDPNTTLSSFEKLGLLRRLSLVRTRNKTKYSVAEHAASDTTGNEALLVFYFRVRFYVPCHCLRGRLIRNLYYEQLKVNYLNYGILCSNEVYFQLAAFSIKVDLYASHPSPAVGDNLQLDENILKLADYFPQWMIDEYGSDYLYANIPELLSPLAGQPRENLQVQFMSLASDPSSNYNLHLYRVSPLEPLLSSIHPPLHPTPTSSLRSGSGCGSSLITLPSGKDAFWWLGVSPSGFVFHEEYEGKRRSPINGIAWSKIGKLSYKHNTFIIQMISGRKVALFTPTSLDAQHIFTHSSQLHEYQTTAHLSSPKSARQVEQQDRSRYNEAYIYSDGEVVSVTQVHGVPDGKEGQKMFVEQSESPHFPQISTPKHSAKHSDKRLSAYI